MNAPFHALEDATVKIACSTSSAVGVLLKMPTGKVQLRFYNAGTVAVFVRKGIALATTATAADVPIAPGATEVFSVNNTEKSPITHYAAITASGTADLYITTGAGL